jgi:hypothetical protein
MFASSYGKTTNNLLLLFTHNKPTQQLLQPQNEQVSDYSI